MIKRAIIAVVAASFVASIGFGQMRYSRPRTSGQSPTPTPAPTPTLTPAPQQKIAPTSAQMQSKPAPTPLQRTMQAPGQMQPKQSPTPPQRTMQTANQQRTMSMQPRPSPTFATIPPKAVATPAPAPMKPTPTPVPPPDVKAYLDRQVANSKDKKFHLTGNGRDIALTPFHVWAQKSTGADSTSTCIDMKSDDGRIYDIDFVTTGAQVTGAKVHKINGEALR